MQKYSTESQIAAIALYAGLRGIEIVKTYTDPGKSGLTIKDRIGLQQLIKDVRSIRPGFETVLVYDISRWGRFQDVDESAYYEFLCREAGISVQYCAEDFDNNGSLSATILKAMKRAMAAEFSRELSTRVFIAKCQMTARGYHTGGQPGYGLRRMLIDERGVERTVLQNGQWKFLHTDRTLLVPGPPDEVQTVRWIFTQYVLENRTISSIVSELNERGIPSFGHRPWLKNNVRAVLSNERYIGNNVFNRTSIRLKSKRVRVDQSQWIRARGVVEPIIDEGLFKGAQARLSRNLHRISRFELLDHLTGLWCRHGTLSAALIERSPSCPCAHTYRRLFGSLLEAFKLVGYRYRTRRPVYASVEQRIANAIVADVHENGGVAEITRQGRQTRILANQEVIVSVSLAHSCYSTLNGKPRWILRHSAAHRSDIAVVATFDERRHRVVDYYVFPGFVLTNPQQLMFDINPIEIEAFRSTTLTPVAHLLQRETIYSGIAYRRPSVRIASDVPLKTLRFNKDGRPTGSRRILRGFEMRSQYVASFVSRCKNFTSSQRTLGSGLVSLFGDDRFLRLLQSENLESTPALLLAYLSRANRGARPESEMQNVARHRESDQHRKIGPAASRLGPERLAQIQQMRLSFADYSSAFLQLLIAASSRLEFATDPPSSRIMSRKEVMQIRRRFRPLEDAARAIFPVYAREAYCHAVTRAYVRTLLDNERAATYLHSFHPEVYRRFKSAALLE